MRKKKLIVLGLIKNDKNEFLLSQRYNPDILDAHLRWDLPGGTNEFGESLVFCYHCYYVNGKTHLNDHKINDLKWVKKDDFKNYDFLPTTKAFIDMV